MKNISAPIVLRRLNTIGYKEAPNEPARRFAQWSFLYLISGEVLTHTGRDSVLCASHDVLLVPPGTEFRVLWYKDSVGYFGGFEESFLLGRTLPLLRATVPVKIKISYSDEIFTDELMDSIIRHIQEPELAAASIDLLLRILHAGSSDGSTICRVFLDDVFCGAPVIGGPSDFAARQGISEADLNREVKEETGLVLTSYKARGIVTFCYKDVVEYMHLYTADQYEGELSVCNEGELSWIDKDKVMDLNIWEGDRIFLKLLLEDAGYFSLKLVYDDEGRLIDKHLVIN